MAGRAGWRRASRYGDGKTAGKRCQRRENAVRNRIFFKVVNGAGTTISTQTYNALGQRVRDVTTSATTDEAYGAGGSLLWRYTGSSSNSSQRAFVPFNGRILAYCLMPNHWHLVLYPRADGDLSQFLRRLTLTHTQRYHARTRRVGWPRLSRPL